MNPFRIYYGYKSLYGYEDTTNAIQNILNDFFKEMSTLELKYRVISINQDLSDKNYVDIYIYYEILH